MLELLKEPWPWYVAGPLVGLVVPLLLLIGGKQFGISANLQHICAAILPTRLELFRYDWREVGGWNLAFAAGIILGGLLGTTLLAAPEPMVGISAATRESLAALGISDFSGLVPREVVSWHGLGAGRGLLPLIGGGFLVGFGSRYAGGCTSGHAIAGLADLQLASLIAVIGFFAGGLAMTHLLLPWIL